MVRMAGATAAVCKDVQKHTQILKPKQLRRSLVKEGADARRKPATLLVMVPEGVYLLWDMMEGELEPMALGQSQADAA